MSEEDKMIEKVLDLKVAIKVPVTKWDDISEGKVYHTPKILTQDAIDMMVMKKFDTHLVCTVSMGGKLYFNQRIRRHELTSMMMAEKKRF